MNASTVQNVKDLKDFLSIGQLGAMAEGTRKRGDDKMFFVEKLEEMADIVNNMAKTYDTEEMEKDDKIVALHYFMSDRDYYIIEKDMEEDEPQYQAYGIYKIASTMDSFKFGYICIAELIKYGAELDLHLTPCTVGALLASKV